MIEIAVVGSNRPALVDDCWACLIGYRWKLDSCGYVYRKVHGKRVYLHHTLLPGKRYPQQVRDHVNRDKMDNRAENLRWLTSAENNQNRDASRCNRTGYRGVLQIGKRFRATAYLDRKAYCLGMFATAEEAGEAVASWRAANMPFSPEAGRGV